MFCWGGVMMDVARRIKNRLRPKMLVTYAGVGALICLATPTVVSLFVGGGVALVGELLRLWAAGHLEKNKDLCTSGPYAYVKNPLYVGTFLILVGFVVMGMNAYVFAAGAIGLVAFFAYYLPYKKRREGERLKRLFGERFEDYDAKVPDFLPRLTPYGAGSSLWKLSTALENSEHWTFMAAVIGGVAIWLRFWLG